MIFDKLENATLYCANEKLAKAFLFLKEKGNDLPLGRNEIDGDELYANVVEYETKSEGVYEGHKDYVDVQYIVSGCEDMEFINAAYAKVKKPYDKDGDYALFEDASFASRVTVHAGEFAVFFPDDIHKPSLATENCSNVKKVIVKVKV